MSGPWEQYQTAPEGPWTQYGGGEKAKKPVPSKIGAEGLPDAIAAVAGDFHPATQLVTGVRNASNDITTRLGQLWAYANRQGTTGNLMPTGVDTPSPGLTPQQQIDLSASHATNQASPMALLGDIGTKIGVTAPLAGPLYAGATRAASTILPGIAAPLVGGAAVGAAVPGITEPNANLPQGALFGAAADAATRGLSRLAQPIIQSPAVQKILQYDIVPTAGSAAGGLVKSIEDKLSSLPFVGDLIKNRQVGARQEMNQAALKLGTPEGENISSIGAEGIAQGKDAFNNAYGRVYKGNQIGQDKTLRQDLDAAKNSTTIPLNEQETKQFDQIIKRDILDRLASGPVPTSDAKTIIESALGKAAFNAGRTPLGEALKNAKIAFRSAMGRSVGPEGAQDLKAIDKAYSNFADVKDAAKSAEGQGGVFTPRQLQRTSKDGSELKRLAGAAQEVLPSSVPNSGTTDRALLNWLLLSAGTAGANHATGALPGREGSPFLSPGYLSALALAPMLYSRTGSRYMVGDLPGQPSLAAALRQMAPYTSGAGALYQQ